MLEGNGRPDGPKANWEIEKTFEKDGIVVQLSKLPLRWPRFSYTVCARGGKDGDKIMRFMPVFARGKGKIEIERKAAAIHALVAEAEEYVRAHLQALEDRKIEKKQFYERKELQRGKPKAKRGLSGGPGSGKTDRRRQRRAKRDAKGSF